MEITSYLLGKKAGGGSGGTSNYNELTNKPSINGVELVSNKTTSDLGIYEVITIEEIVDLLNSEQPESPSYDFTDGNWEQDGSTWYTTNQDIIENYLANYNYGWEGPIEWTIYTEQGDKWGYLEFVPEDEYYTGNMYDEFNTLVYTAEYKEIEVSGEYVYALVLTENL